MSSVLDEPEVGDWTIYIVCVLRKTTWKIPGLLEMDVDKWTSCGKSRLSRYKIKIGVSLLIYPSQTQPSMQSFAIILNLKLISYTVVHG